MWENKRSRFKKPDQDYYSIENKLKSEGKIDEKFKAKLSSLTMEEVIGLRLELAAKAVNYKLYGLNLWNSLPDIIKRECVEIYLFRCADEGEMASFLGIDKSALKKLLKKYDITNYFTKEK